jgi:hypothetical protein
LTVFVSVALIEPSTFCRRSVVIKSKKNPAETGPKINLGQRASSRRADADDGPIE